MPTDAAPSLVAVPSGTVTMTDARTRRSWSADVAAIEIAAYPLTQEEYAQVTGLRPAATLGARLPVEGVSWWDAIRFCNALSERAGLTPAYRLGADEAIVWDPAAEGYRLPTEAEWEHSCRAGTAGPRYGDLDEIAWYRGNSDEHPHDVGGKQPNAWGLYDTLGSVWEWCWDFADPERYGTYRVLRGGGWFDQHWSCRASVRRGSYPGLQIDDVGFRIARNS
ncbi:MULTISPECIES: formylglycine-generating enzyme family protein [Cryobacterium]|uniref:Sulfatase-modifying factor protein n=1 Tax=Cryobacterium zongtaii TaxID=1259217 RepID=A0A2S3ZE56_9MICO|nr:MULTISPECIES: SUMF1/EgtB/PvdO family nonheme iron enzyme [Cryobacterium]POH64803.1 sulfatase-modifying factor protein [Cryobacterium zongtaii]POH65136.1 sulfatase-modifying factor protein [Cryobacterium zongtaii]TFC44759.1 formylglycine-generating enzyme family protein [Cryobacterium sp. TMN-39-2]